MQQHWHFLIFTLEKSDRIIFIVAPYILIYVELTNQQMHFY